MKKTFLIIIFILSICFMTCGFFVSKNQPPYRIEGKKAVYIKNQTDFIDYTKNYNAYQKAYLSTNITIMCEFSSIGSKEKEFNGIFDGCGYSINLINTATNISLFNIIGKNGIVKNLEVSIKKSIIESSSFGFIANQNKGQITNVIVTTNDVVIKKDTMFGIITSLNQGIISNCYVETTIKNNISQSKKASIISGCCGFNDGEISSVITNVTFEKFEELSKDNLLNGTINNSYGIICGINNKINNVKNNYYLGNSELIFVDYLNVTNIETLTEDTLLNKYSFNNKLWNLTINNSKINLSLEDGVSI